MFFVVFIKIRAIIIKIPEISITLISMFIEHFISLFHLIFFEVDKQCAGIFFYYLIMSFLTKLQFRGYLFRREIFNTCQSPVKYKQTYLITMKLIIYSRKFCDFFLNFAVRTENGFITGTRTRLKYSSVGFFLWWSPAIRNSNIYLFYF